MKKLLTLITFKAFLFTGFAQSRGWQQQVNHTIDVHLDDKKNSLNGFSKIHYFNNSPDTLHFIWFHLWPNAYKNDRTAYSEQLLKNGNTKFYFSKDEERGYINQLDFRVDDIRVDVTDHPQHQDIIKLTLPQPLAPGGDVLITTPFHVKMPYNFTGEGYKGQAYQFLQWYPKPAVYDQNGWHPMPLLQQGGPYSETGDYEVTISLPENYVVAASGYLQDASEIQWLNSRQDFKWEIIKKRVRIKKGTYKTITQLYPESSTTIKTLRFRQQQVHDFVWAADKRWAVVSDSVMLQGGKSVTLYSYILHKAKESAVTTLEKVKKALAFYDSSLLPLSFSNIHVLSANQNAAYANMVFIGHAFPGAPVQTAVDKAVSYLYTSAIPSINSRQHPWLTEGVSEYYSKQADAVYAKSGRSFFSRLQANVLPAVVAVRKDQPVDLQANQFSKLNYWLGPGIKTSAWLQMLQDSLGEIKFSEAVKSFYQSALHQHLYPEDLMQELSASGGRNVDEWFHLLQKQGPLTVPAKRKLKFTWPGMLLPDSNFRNIGVGPAIGYNYYDGLMVGGLIHNYSLPFTPFQFIAVPLYGIGSKQLNGITRLSYTWYPDKYFYKLEVGLSAARFTSGYYNDAEKGKLVRLDFLKLAPYARMVLDNKGDDNVNEYLQLKYYSIREDQLNFSQNPMLVSTRPVYEVTNGNRGLLQLKWVKENSRILYPYKWNLQFESGKDFGRLALTGNYFFNYAKGGGLDIRAFAGKFFYLGDKSSLKRAATYRYHLNMSAPKGDEDYTYSNYFAGRDEFEGFFSQQVIVRDGAFKVRTDLLSNKVGRTDDWLGSLNFTTSIHPRFPVKLFADIGTYSDAWKNESDATRILYDAGIQLSLFKNILNIYVPIIYSNVYKDYYKSTPGNNFWQRISFSVDIQNIRFKTFHPMIPL